MNTSVSNNSTVASSSNESEGSSMITGSKYGEPLLKQHLVLDFKRDEDIDTDFIQRKCVAFWEFVARTPELQHIETAPDYKVFECSMTPSSYVRCERQLRASPHPLEATAVSMLELVENKGLIDRAFEGRLPRSHCSLDLPDYCADALPVLPDKVQDGDERRNIKKGQKSRGLLKKMCLQMNEWDSMHPQYMKPPGASLTLVDCKKPKNI